MHIQKLAFAFTALVAVGLTSCSTTSPDATASVSSPEDAYFVVGVKPNNMMLQIDRVQLNGNTIVKSLDFPPRNFGQIQGGYIVGKQKAGEALAVVTYSEMAGGSIFGLLFYPCKETISFKLEPGKVNYITDLSYIKDKEIVQNTTDNFMSAKEYIDLHYPGLSKDLVESSYQVVQFPQDYPRIGDKNDCRSRKLGR